MNSAAETRELLTKKLEAKGDVVETMKKFLRRFSKHLRRDFLALLVKMCSKQFEIQTVRLDWRTRKGMLAFLSDNWSRLQPLILSDTFFRWYCCFFSQIESLLIIRKFVMFLFANWEQYKALLYNRSTVLFISLNILEFDELISKESITAANFPQLWLRMEPGIQLCKLIDHFHNGMKAAPQQQQAVQVQPAETSESIEFAPEVLCPAPDNLYLENYDNDLIGADISQDADMYEFADFIF